mmetsp:Transcript_37099/g.48758  ORF Transcript_37099/g.48758 Transcript_37099/m.48758 type:complete len:103 (-) Transcript_37099:66-374(-)
MRKKMIGLMRERNLYLEKCRAIEQFGERIDWQGTSDEDTDFLANVHEVLYMQQDETGESFEDEMQEHEFNSASGEQPVLANMDVGRGHQFTGRLGQSNNQYR